MTDYAPWLMHIADDLEQGGDVVPCHKALRRAANKLDTQSAEGKLKDEKLNSIQRFIDAQAEDEGLWFVAVYATEDYLQTALRKLHAVIEAKP